MIRFVGDIEYYQQRMRSIYTRNGVAIIDHHHNNPVTLGWNYDDHKTAPGSDACGFRDGGCLFRLNGKKGVPRFTVVYAGKSYTVNQNDPDDTESQPVDHSLEVIALLNQLVNLNKSASEIRSTPLIQVVQ
jgi:hypothetical protein